MPYNHFTIKDVYGHRTFVLAFCITNIIFSGCKKFVEVKLPNNRITAGAVFENSKTATAATLAMYEMLQRVSCLEDPAPL
mgnify:CR=1 FL=1